MANIKITGLPELVATPDDADVLEIVDDVVGTPTSKKITIANLKAVDVTAAANIADEALAVGDGGAKGIKALALGAAGLKLFVNAAGNANEYASGMKIGTFTRDISVTGAQAISGVGFKPSFVIFLTTIAGIATFSIGFDSGALAYCCYYGYSGGTAWSYDAGNSLRRDTGAGVFAKAEITTLGSDGFTLTWAKAGSPTGTLKIFYFVFR